MKRHLILSEKGKEMLDFPEGFLHWRKNSRGKRIYWRCIYYEAGKNGERSCKCPGRAVTVDGQPKITSAHNHLSDKNQSELKRFQCKVQQEAMLTKDKPRAIISTLLTSVKAEARPAIRLSVVGRTIRKRRNIANVEPANPKSLRELQISASFATINNENCLKYDGWNGEERILIVSTNRCLDLLVAIPKWGCDATYEVVPLLFGQLWIIYARLAHTYAPMVFVLMNRKLESSYRFVLEKLKKLREKISPLSIAVDFEKAEWNAFEAAFPRIKHSACFFHFRQSLIRNICSKNKVLYESDDEFCNWTNLIAALAFVPVKDVSEAFEIIRDHSEQSEYAEELCLFLDYFEDTYVGRIKKGTERKKPRKWSVHQLVKENEPRTNNGIESFNGQLLRTMACSHPTVWKLLTAVLDELVLADQRVSSYWSGGSTSRRNNAYLQLSERLRKTVQRYSTQPKIEYLKSIAHNLGGFLVEKKIEKLQPTVEKPKLAIFQSEECQVVKEIRTGRTIIFEYLDQDLQDELCLSFDLQVGVIRPGNRLRQIYFDSERSKPKKLKHIEADGNCLFRSLSYCISSTEANHGRLRHLIVEFVKNKIWRRKESCANMGIPAKGSSDVAKYGSTLHIIAATKLFDVNILTFNEDIGWTLYTPDVETGPSPELLQDAEKPTFALSYNGSHFDVILEI
uniref:OTU domain-containing protein n=1 Tax=Ditylenchus dipsaci TaxID=166011 RepID=A0A915EEK5_9BILA